MYRQHLYRILFFVIPFLLFSCVPEQPENLFQTQEDKESRVAEERSEMLQELESKARELEDMREEAEALIEKLNLREEDLNARAALLDSIEGSLKNREVQLIESQAQLKSFEKTAYFILFSGIFLLVISLVVLFYPKNRKHKNGRNGWTAPEPASAAVLPRTAVTAVPEPERKSRTSSDAGTKKTGASESRAVSAGKEPVKKVSPRPSPASRTKTGRGSKRAPSSGRKNTAKKDQKPPPRNN
jgi:hypothetical protein